MQSIYSITNFQLSAFDDLITDVKGKSLNCVAWLKI